MKHLILSFMLLVLLAACGKNQNNGGGVVVGNGLSGESPKAFFSETWELGFNFGDGLKMDVTDEEIRVWSPTDQVGMSSALFVTRVDTGDAKLKSTKDLREWATRKDKNNYERIDMRHSGARAVYALRMKNMQDIVPQTVITYYFLTRSEKVYRVELESSVGDEEGLNRLEALMGTLYYNVTPERGPETDVATEDLPLPHS